MNGIGFGDHRDSDPDFLPMASLRWRKSPSYRHVNIACSNRPMRAKRGAKLALELANAPNEILSTVQVGITLIGTLAGAFGGATIADKLAVRAECDPPDSPFTAGALHLLQSCF